MSEIESIRRRDESIRRHTIDNTPPCPAGCDVHTDAHGESLTYPHWVTSEWVPEGGSGWWFSRFTCGSCGGWVNDGTQWHDRCPQQATQAAAAMAGVAASIRHPR